jgi:hypothetical protein
MASSARAPHPCRFLPLAIFLQVIIGAPLLLLSKRVGQVLDAMPVTWLVALQLYRVFGSWALAAWLRGALPGNAQERLYAVERALPDCEVLLHTLPTLSRDSRSQEALVSLRRGSEALEECCNDRCS